MSKILIIEEDIAVRTLIVEWLTLDGYDACQAADEVGDRNTVKLVIVNVPDLMTRGVKILQYVRMNHPEASLIVLSTQLSRSMASESDLACRLMVSHLVAKPFTRSELLYAVVAAIGRPS